MLNNCISFKATDGDEINSNNSQINYCIVGDNDACMSHTHFHVNGTGSVLCIKALDYEDLPVSSRGKAGELRLKIKAYDNGNPILYSTVNLTILVQVTAKIMYEIPFLYFALFLLNISLIII